MNVNTVDTLRSKVTAVLLANGQEKEGKITEINRSPELVVFVEPHPAHPTSGGITWEIEPSAIIGVRTTVE